MILKIVTIVIAISLGFLVGFNTREPPELCKPCECVTQQDLSYIIKLTGKTELVLNETESMVNKIESYLLFIDEQEQRKEDFEKRQNKSVTIEVNK